VKRALVSLAWWAALFALLYAWAALDVAGAGNVLFTLTWLRTCFAPFALTDKAIQQYSEMPRALLPSWFTNTLHAAFAGLLIWHGAIATGIAAFAIWAIYGAAGDMADKLRRGAAE
jgi:hypothetical protein